MRRLLWGRSGLLRRCIFICAALFSLIWLGGVLIFWLGFAKADEALTLNEAGDFAAGAFAPLAFIWLVAAVFLQQEQLKLQARELRASTKALRMQVRETRDLVKKNEAAVTVARESFNEQTSRAKEAQIDRLIDTLARWIYLHAGGLMISNMQRRGDEPIFVINADLRDNADAVFRLANSQLLHKWLRVHEGDYRPKHKDSFLRSIRDISKWLTAILESEQEGSYPVLRARVEMLELDSFRRQLQMMEEWAVAAPPS